MSKVLSSAPLQKLPSRTPTVGRAASSSPRLWGRLSRNAEGKQPFKPLAPDEHYQFESTEELGWHRATCRFIVPPGVRLLRCFEVGDVLGDWNTLEIRRHAVKMVSDTVTRSDANETAKLSSLRSTGEADPNAKLPELEGEENEEAKQVTHQKWLEDTLEKAKDRSKTLKDRAHQQETRGRLIACGEGVARPFGQRREKSS